MKASVHVAAAPIFAKTGDKAATLTRVPITIAIRFLVEIVPGTAPVGAHPNQP